MAKATLGLEETIVGVLCYLLTWLSGIVFLIVERENTFVRFHAMQSVATFLPLTVLGFVAGFVPVIGWVVSMLVGALTLILWLVLMIKAFQGERYKLPFVGDWAEQNS